MSLCAHASQRTHGVYSVAFFHGGKAMPFWSEIPGRPESQVGRWHAMRKKGDKENSLGWTEVALLEEENVDWERVGVVALPATRHLRRWGNSGACLLLPFFGHSGIRLTVGHAHHPHSDGKCSSRSQSGVVVNYPCDPGLYRSLVHVYKLIHKQSESSLRLRLPSWLGGHTRSSLMAP